MTAAAPAGEAASAVPPAVAGRAFGALARELALLAEALGGAAQPLLPGAAPGADAPWRVDAAADALRLPDHGEPGETLAATALRWRLALLQQLQWQAQGSWPVLATLPPAGALRSVFTQLEHWRAEAGLLLRWPGAAPGLHAARVVALRRRPAALARDDAACEVDEALLQLSLGRPLASFAGTAGVPRWLRSIDALLAALARPGSTADDSLHAAHALLALARQRAGTLVNEDAADDEADAAAAALRAIAADPRVQTSPGRDDLLADDGSPGAAAPGAGRDDPSVGDAGPAAAAGSALPSAPTGAANARPGAADAAAAGAGILGPGTGTGTDTEASCAEPSRPAWSPGPPGTAPLPPGPDGARVHFVDEWDHRRRRYLPAWCRVIETRLQGGELDRVRQARRHHADLLRRVWRQFAALRPQSMQVQRGCADGDEIDLDAALEARLDRHRGAPAAERLHRRRQRGRREVATVFLVDMSASTDFEVPAPRASCADGTAGASAVAPVERAAEADDDPVYLYGPAPRGPLPEVLTPKRRVIDVEHDALVLMCDALAALGDRHAVYGFTGQGRHRVELHVAKEFDEPFDARRAAALAALQPRGATRMGAAIRRALAKLARQPERQKLLLVISDGYPQDQDYGPDRLDDDWGLHDTAQALAEARHAGVETFCVTVDPAGHDYLRRMCPDGRYRVIDEVAQLPAALGAIYRTLRG